MLACYQAAASTGNIIGPLLFKPTDAPRYHRGLRSVLGVFIALVCVVLINLAYLIWLNKQQEKKRVRNGKKAVISDHSMEFKYVPYDVDVDDYLVGRPRLGDNAFLDLTDRQNDEFVYVP